jgi:prophage antirepressor-like protein/regulator of replication initiation timing
MDIIKTFENNNAGMHITIKGTHEEPLFRASDIGAILDIVKIRNTISDFDNTEKVAHTVDTLGGPQEVLFLTEKGLYQVMFTSRKPIAKKFKNWVCEVIKEIRLNGKYELEKQLELKDIQKEQNLLTNFHKKPIVYIGFAEYGIIKPGFTNDITERLSVFTKEISPEFTFEYVYETVYNREVEKRLFNHPDLKKRRLKKEYNGIVKTELFQLDETFTIKSIDIIVKDIIKEIELYETDKDKNSEIDKLKLQLIEQDITIIDLKDQLTTKTNQNNSLKIENKELKIKLSTQNNTICDLISDPVKIEDFIQDNEIYDEAIVDIESRKFLVARHIKSSKEELFSCPTKIANFVKFDPKAILPYIDFPRLIHGYHIRTFGNPYWQPLKEYTYLENSTPMKNTRAIQSINTKTGEVLIYESLAEAVRILNKDDTYRSKIGKYVGKDKIFKDNDGQELKWNYLTSNQCGDYITILGKFYTIDQKKFSKFSKAISTDKTATIIARNIKTGEEIYCKHATEARKVVGNSDITNYLDQPVHIKGFSFRTVNSDKYWIPPDNFKYITDYVTKQKFYIKTTNKTTKEISYYNSALELAVLNNLCKIDDDEKIKANIRELVKRVITGEVKTTNNKILNDYILEEYESCGYYIYKNGNKEIILC